MPTIRILAVCGSSDILLKGLILYKMPMSEKGNNSIKIYDTCLKIDQFIYTLVETCMPTVRILASAVLWIIC